MATIHRNGQQAEGWKIDLAFSRDEIDQLLQSGRWTFSGDDLTQTHGEEVVQLIVTVRD